MFNCTNIYRKKHLFVLTNFLLEMFICTALELKRKKLVRLNKYFSIPDTIDTIPDTIPDTHDHL